MNSVFIPVEIILQNYLKAQNAFYKKSLMNRIKFALIKDIDNYKIIMIIKKRKRPTDATYDISSLLEYIICTQCYMIYMHYAIFVRFLTQSFSEKRTKYELQYLFHYMHFIVYTSHYAFLSMHFTLCISQYECHSMTFTVFISQYEFHCIL